MDLSGRVVLVTGGAHRVGKAIAVGLAEAGADIAVNYLSSARAATETVEELSATGVRAAAFLANVSQPEEVASMVVDVEARLGPVDVLVNSASMFRPDRFPTDELGTWHATLDVVLDGAYYCANAVAPSMLARGDGAIVNILDLSALQPWPNQVAHSVAKAASLALVRQLAVELAPAVRCNAVALGPTIPAKRFSPDQIEHLRLRTLLERWGGGEEAARAVRYLAEADTVTGECLVVDAGERDAHVRDRFLD